MATAAKSLREEIDALARRLGLVEQALELAVTWQYGLRQQADELLDRLRAEASDDSTARVDALEHEIAGLRRALQDLSQAVTSGLHELEALPAPADTTPRGPVEPVPGPAPTPELRAPRALSGLRFAMPPERGRDVEVEATVDGYDDGTVITFAVGERGEEPEVTRAEVRDGVARVRWYVPATLPADATVKALARLGGFERSAEAVLAPPERPEEG